MNYFLLFVVAILSLLATIYFDLSETMKILTSTPLVGALLVALFQLLRDDEKFIRDSIMQDREHNFMLAATSHMSEVVFDKHVQFSEDYLMQVRKLIGALWFSSASGKSGGIEIVKLAEIRVRYQLWLSNDMEHDLRNFENELLKLSNRIISVNMKETQESNLEDIKKAELTKDSIKNFSELIDLEEEDGAQMIITGILQMILGVTELTKMRDTLLLDTQ
jgi:hypothetical protein